MSDSTKAAKADIDVDELIAQSDTGARHPAGVTGKMVMVIAFIWSCFQLYIASSVPFWLSQTFGINFVFNNTESRIVHLAFAIALASFAYPLFNKSPRDRIPYYDYLLAILGVGSCLYLLVFKEDIANRAGLPTSGDLIASTIGLAALALSVYRALGLPMLCVAAVFMVYVFFGHMEFLPDVIQWKGATYSKALWHYWMQTEGVFGVALGVSASMIFLFVLFGALLEKAGAGGYFIKLAFALLGHMRGGPAKAAVVASALSGLYSGSSIANVVTTGTFTIPLMKRTGFPAEKAGAVEVASSVNGQLTPPVMGAAAFLITEFVGISYTELIKNAALPALISYIALVYIVHLEALKMGLEGMEKPSPTASLARRALGFLSGFIGIALLGIAVYYGLGWIKHVLPGATAWTASGIFLIAYLALVSIAARHPDLDDDPNAPIEELPRAGEVAVTGLHYLLPIIVLLWCILVEKLSPALSAFWATLGMVFIVVTQHTIKGILRGETDLVGDIRRGIGDFCEGMIGGARNMIAIGVATGVAGVIIGSISLTGAHQIVGEFVEYVSGGNLMVMLILVAVMSLILGMGLPTTANYIVVSSLMAPVIVSVGAQSGLIVPLVAVHLFVFYFGILADDTPPVGLAAFAAAAISGGDPIKTGIQGFGYDIRTALLPFMFIFNTEILLIDVSPMKAVVVFVVAVIAMLLFAAGTQGYFFVRNRIWETAALLLIAFTLFRPGFWLDLVENPYVSIPPAQAFQTIEAQPDGKPLRMVFTGPDYQKPDQMDELTLMVDPGAKGPSGQERMSKLGLDFTEQDGKLVMEEPFGPPYLQKFRDFDFYGDTPVELARIEMPAERMAKEVFYIPAALLLGLVMLLQWMRLKKQKAAA